MAQPRQDHDDAQRVSRYPSSAPPTMLKALLREHHLQNYGMFKRTYQKVARQLDKSLVDTYPSVSTFRRWLAGTVKTLPHAEHCAVLEAMLPGWTTADLFQPYIAPQDVEGSTLLQELLRRRHIHNYRAFCRAYDIAATPIDKTLVGRHPAEQQFHRWISGDMTGLPHPGHCTVLEAMFPGYSARQLFEVIESSEPADVANPQCSTSDAAADAPGGADLVSANQTLTSEAASMAGLQFHDGSAMFLTTYLESIAESNRKAPTTPEMRDSEFDQLVHFLTNWAHTMKRRDILRSLSWAATAVFHVIDLDEQERITSVLSNPRRIDEQTVDHIEAVLWRCQRQDDNLGPQAVLNTVLAQRDLIRSLLPACRETLRSRMLTVLSNASRHAGWLSFDLNAFKSAEYYYEDARALAHEAEDVELVAFVLCNMSHSATWRRKPRIGIDHAVAACEWSKRTGDMRLRAYAADVAARAYAADKQSKTCLAALDTAEMSLGSAGGQPLGYIYFYDEGVHVSTRCSCHLELDEPERAATYAQRALDTLDQSYTRNVAIATINLGIARLQSCEVDEAARLLGNAGEISAHNSSARLVELLKQGRDGMQPWEKTATVRALDDRLMAYGLI